MKDYFKSMFLKVSLICLLGLTILDAQPLDFTAYTAGNPVIPKGATGTWDQLVWSARAIVVNDTFYLTYNGTSDFENVPVSIGFATSVDGFTFTKSDSNPILSGDFSGFDATVVADGCLLFENGTWYLYYSGRSTLPNMPGDVVGRATATNPDGPWTTSEDTLLSVGSSGEWDSEFITPNTILETDSGLVMYYWSGDVWPGGGTQIGLATSTDGGLNWQKYDDPTTTAPPFAESDPVLKTGHPGTYDDFSIWLCSVLKTSNQWEMSYAGDDGDSISICYATSSDGIIWNKYHVGNPIYTPSRDPLATDILEVPQVVLNNDTYYMYYDYGQFSANGGISLATAPVTSIEPLFDNNPSTFELQQNYPNPFNPSTTIEYQLPKASQVELSIYNILGQKVATLVSNKQPAGHSSVQWDASGFASGIYFYKMITDNNFYQSKKLILLK